MVKMSAESALDLTIMSSYLQDTTVRVGDMAWLPSQRRFALIGNRFMWEEKGATRHRCRAGLHIDHVISAQTRGFSPRNKDHILDLLTVHATEQDDKVTIRIAFAGGADVHLEAEIIEVHLDDKGEPWETPHIPEHGPEDGEET